MVGHEVCYRHRQMTRARVLRRMLATLAGLCLVGCLSPTLPLPPPSRPDVSSPDADGMVHIQGIAAPRSEVIAWNHANDKLAGDVTGDDSSYDFFIPGQSGDLIELWYTQGTDESTSITFKVPAATP